MGKRLSGGQIAGGSSGPILTRRRFVKLGLTAGALSGLGIACGGNGQRDPWEPPPPSGKVYRLTDGTTLYDDFDGNGGLQTYDGQNLAVAGTLSSQLWYSGSGKVVISNPVVGISPIARVRGGGYVLMITNALTDLTLTNLVFLMLQNPPIVEFVDSKSFSADVALSSASTVEAMSAKLDYHTTIPEQPPGRSWATSVGIRKRSSGRVSLFVTAYNVNTDYRYNVDLGDAQLDRWYNLRLDVITKQTDGSLPDNQFRLDYYVDGILVASEIPEDAAILIDPDRTGGGPNRSLIVSKEAQDGNAVAYFDNIRAVYKDRLE